LWLRLFLAIGSGGKPLKGAARTASRRSVSGSKANGFLRPYVRSCPITGPVADIAETALLTDTVEKGF
jgi:hypothetical protein